MARRALIVANGRFADARISTLNSPVPDAKRLETLLSRPDVGGYEVTSCLDASMAEARRALQRFFDGADPDDFHFVLITGHGIKDRGGKLHFATADTQVDALSATSVEARFVIERMDESSATQQLLFLDTCYSGAFQRGIVTKSAALAVTRDDFGDDESAGKAIITATTAIQLAGERESEGAAQSVFTKHLIQGIESGAADPKGTGEITLGALFEHIRNKMKGDAPGQKPQPFWFGLDGTVVVARNPAGPSEDWLSPDLQARVAHPDRSERGKAVEELLNLARAQGADAPDARKLLVRLGRGDDSMFVRHLARDALSALRIPLDGESRASEPESTPAPQPAGAAELQAPTESAALARRLTSVCEAIDRFICYQSPLAVFMLAAIMGGSVIILSSAVEANFVQAVPGPGGWSCQSAGKELGMWMAPNWSIVYLLLFPIFLSQISSMSWQIRKIIGELDATGAIVDRQGQAVGEAALDAELRRELGANNLAFALLGAMTGMLALIGWWTTVGSAIYHSEIGNQVVDWSTWSVACGRTDLRWPSLIFTLVAYLWMGFALFVYFACLFLGLNYSLFLRRLASGRRNRGAPPVGRLVFRHKMTSEQLRDFFTPYFIACLFGFLAAYCMRLNARYVGEPDLNIMGFWLRDLHWMFPSVVPASATGAAIPAASNQTLITAVFVALVTLGTLLFTARQLSETFRDAKDSLLNDLDTSTRRQSAFRNLSAEEIERIKGAKFLRRVIPNAVPFALLTAGIGIAIALGLRSGAFILTALIAGAAWIVVLLVRSTERNARD